MYWHHWFALGNLLAGLSVAFGAFGAHALKAKLPPESLQLFETAVRYQIYHAFALIAVAFASTRIDNLLIKLSGASFLLGILLFCGSLHILIFVTDSSKWVWPLTPIGGLFFIVGWILLSYAAFY